MYNILSINVITKLNMHIIYVVAGWCIIKLEFGVVFL